MALPADLEITSTDSHVIEPPDLWTGRVAAAYRDRAPRLVAEADGDWWYADGLKLQSVTGGTDAGVRFEDQTRLRMAARMDEVRKGAYDPDAKVADMDADGVRREVVYTTLGLRLWRVPDAGLVRALFRAYNEWVAEFCAAYPDRLAGVAMILLDDVADGVTDLDDAARLGLKGAMISVHPGEARSYAHPDYEPFWAAAEGHDMPLSLHIGSNRTAPPPGAAGAATAETDIKLLSTPAQYSTVSHWVQLSIADLIFSGVFARHPGVRVVSLEHEASWAPHLLQTMDYTYTQRARRAGWVRFDGDTLPSDYFHTNVFVSFQEDALALQLRSVIGVENLVWGSDYPHHESTFPHSRRVLAEVLAGVPDSERDLIVDGNARRLYRFG